MFKSSLRRFSFILTFEILFIIADICINSFSYLTRGNKVCVIFLFLWVFALNYPMIDNCNEVLSRLQDALLLLSMTAIIFSLYSTYVYQVGTTMSLKKIWFHFWPSSFASIGWTRPTDLQKVPMCFDHLFSVFHSHVSARLHGHRELVYLARGPNSLIHHPKIM